MPAVFIRLNLVDESGNDVVPVYWSDNYITLWGKEKMDVEVSWTGGTPARATVAIQISGANVVVGRL